MKTMDDKQERRRKKKLFRSYNKRNAKIRGLGEESYKVYLQGPRWELIREAIMVRDFHVCGICGCSATAIHHTCYSKAILMGTNLTGAYAICGPCHKFIEFDKEGNKVRLSEANKRAYFLARLKGRKFIHPSKREDSYAKEITAKLQNQLANLA